MRTVTSVLLAIILLVGTPAPTAADGGATLEALIAQATGISRTHSNTLAACAAARSADADFRHVSLASRCGLTTWSWGEVLAWNRGCGTLTCSVSLAIQGWQGSSSHWTILTSRAYAEIGCDHRSGLFTDPNGQVWTDYLVCVLGTNTASPPPTPAPAPPAPHEPLPDTSMTP